LTLAGNEFEENAGIALGHALCKLTSQTSISKPPVRVSVIILVVDVVSFSEV